MEALTAAAVAALTLYDMIKAVDKAAVIENVRLLSKSGGKSGVYQAPEKKSALPRKSAPGSEPSMPRPSMPRPSAAKPKVLMGEVAAPRAQPDRRREAFRAFMTAQRLRPTSWAKEAGVASGEILSFLTGRSRGFSGEVAEKLARAARVRVEDMFRC
jgi:hypothetical protein